MFSTERLREAVQSFFGVPCKLVKMAQGGYHKVGANLYAHSVLANMVVGVRYLGDRRVAPGEITGRCCSGCLACLSRRQDEIRGQWLVPYT